MSVAYQGAPGAFSHEACLRFLPTHEPMSFATFADVVDAVEAGAAELGMLPTENNEAGQTGARELIEAANLRIVREVTLPVRMHLLGRPGARIEDIKTVRSHPVALRQCSHELMRLGVQTLEVSNTAFAAKTLTNITDAVLASAAAARIYGLTILLSDVQNRADNATRFAIIDCSSSG